MSKIRVAADLSPSVVALSESAKRPGNLHTAGVAEVDAGDATDRGSRAGMAHPAERDGRNARKFEIHSAMRILRGQLLEPGPEELLWLAVIERAVKDAYSIPTKNEKLRDNAIRWLDSAYFSGVAEAIGLNPEWTRQKIHQIPRIEHST